MAGQRNVTLMYPVSPFRKQGFLIAGLIKGYQGLRNPDHKAAYFWAGGVGFGGKLWIARRFSSMLRTMEHLANTPVFKEARL